MRPITLTMQAFGSYGEKTVIDFQKATQNVFLITGDTGAGKSTIFDAMAFALFGEASSSANKKDGAELQSQYTDAEPYVELTFSQMRDGVENIYTIRRSPRHRVAYKKKEGYKAIKESVELILPDQGQYSENKKEVDQKIEEIIGLNKGQFMQVAMIAQGEFMEVLRAKSDEKKKIFQGLFHTKIYEKIVEELAQRKKENESEMEKVRNACQADVAQIICDDSEEICLLKEEVIEENQVTVPILEELVEALKKGRIQIDTLFEELQSIKREKEEAFFLAQKEVLMARKLLEDFLQCEQEKDELKKLLGEGEKIKEREKRAKKVLDAQELVALYQIWNKKREEKSGCEQLLFVKKKELPELEEKLEEERQRKEETRKLLDVQMLAFEKVKNQVEQMSPLFEEQRENVLAIAKMEKRQQEIQSTLLKEERELRKLRDNQLHWQERWEEVSNIQVEIVRVQQVLQEVAEKKERAQRRKGERKRYDELLIKYEHFLEEYKKEDKKANSLYTQFLDEQAGVLAKEKLRENEPCPVCGSLHHPHPYQFRGNEEISREIVDRQRQIVENTKEKLETVSRQMGERKVSIDELSRGLEDEERIEEEKNQAEEILKKLKEKEEIAQALKHNLELARRRIPEKEQFVEEKKREAEECTYQLTRLGLRNEEIQRQFVFSSEEEMKNLLEKERAKKERLQLLEKESEESFLSYEKEAANVRLIISSAEADLPRKKEEEMGAYQEYATAAKQRGMENGVWVEYTKYPKEDAILWQDQAKEYDEELARKSGRLDLLKATIAGKEKPDIEFFEKVQEERQREKSEVEEKLQFIQQKRKINEGVQRRLEIKLSEQEKMMMEQARVSSLYERLAGKRTGARMDIETFVLRYYLQRILHSANTRFLQMSSGQFCLEMVDEENAGAGKNKGLDLMVYSNVTGKRREIRTLSGGESFMAALSLALGMADHIQETTSSIHLDVMFIDEGFGALDDRSRNDAIRVLQEMAGGKKMVGIISHVTELKQMLENQLVVKKDQSGSHAKWIIG